MLRLRSATNTPVLMNALALCVVVLAGGLTLAWPFWGDQALFTLYSREMTQGAVLYRDVFDVKQPGIFLFYAAGGLLFGFTEIGMHAFELVYWLAFSIFALVALRPYFATRWAPPLVPVFTVGTYYFGAGLLDIGQVEILVAFPILLAWWLIDRADPATARGVRRYAAAGLAAAAIVMLKHLYLLIVFAFLAYAALRSRRQGKSIRDLGRALAAFVISLAAPLILVLLYFAYHGQLGRIWWAYFQMAPAAQLLTPRRFDYLKLGMRRFLIAHGPLVILAVLASVHVLRRRAGPQRDLGVGMLLWGVVGAFAFIGLQGWPEYKWALFTVPVGILAALGAEAFVDLARTCGWTARPLNLVTGAGLVLAAFAAGAWAQEIQTRLLASVLLGGCSGVTARLLGRGRKLALDGLCAALAISAGLVAIEPAHKLMWLRDENFAITSDGRRRLMYAVNPSYRAADRDLAVLERDAALPGSIYVFGDPILLYRANRRQAVPILGWGPEFLDDRAWKQLVSDLRAVLPPYIVVDGCMESYIRDRYPPVIELLESRYEIAFTGDNGRWYVLRAGASPGHKFEAPLCGPSTVD